MFDQADAVDYGEGLTAYINYHRTMLAIATRYGIELSRVVAAFVAMSPQNDYVGNLRSVITLLESDDPRNATTSTFNHCKLRACSYLDGSVDFLTTARGPKIINFYWNIMEPSNRQYVTIDGHMVAAWRNERLTMEQAVAKTRGNYYLIAKDVKRLAGVKRLIPNQVQAIIWFTRKRTLNVRYSPQMDIFDGGNNWRTFYPIDELTTF